MKFVHGRKSKIGPEAPSAKGFAWFFQALATGRDLDGVAEVRHAGKCGRCGRKLTVPESIDTGFGPSCAGEIGIAWIKDHPENFKAMDFILAGNATITITSVKTGERFTYKVKRATDDGVKPWDCDKPYFVSVLTGPDNWDNYRYLGCIWP